ncbi:transmembrane protein 164 [Ischnura elegans]|uniref:transmembrane protein 164 n=1 Tax=Ischnura elegans TaxID=197161 RepID=UPI001ED8BEA4|nr:transmembrane protein 164 [Ischnura elegans]XP_046401880.1 transmembrane protein 164 [Ischnura elegans]XP_046401881.1 transmembrane protein 164 [Ischnura elegans]
MFDWAVAGVNVSIPSEGGPECAAFMPMHIRIFESVIALGIAIQVLITARYNPSFKNIPRFPRCTVETLGKHKPICHQSVESIEVESEPGAHKFVDNESQKRAADPRKENEAVYAVRGRKFSLITESLSDRNRKNWLLVLLCLVWGAEIGFKFASRTVIFLLNPCHVVTAVQIYLLAAEPSLKVTVMFRFHLYFLNGAILAFLFPNTESRILPCESSLYWIQHTMMLVVPIYLLCLKGVYNVEPMRDISWGVVGFSMNMVYHFAVLQPIAMISEVNLNQLLCPAQQDPFRGNYYRTAALIHQSILCIIVAKLCCICASFLTSSAVYTENPEQLPQKETAIFSCDKNPSPTAEKATSNSSQVFECESCLEKNVVGNTSQGLGNVQNKFSSERNEDILSQGDGIIPSKEKNDSSSQLRLRNLSNEGIRS